MSNIFLYNTDGLEEFGHITTDTNAYLKTFGNALSTFHAEMEKVDLLDAWTITYGWYKLKDYEEMGKSFADLCWLLENIDNNHLETLVDHDTIAAAEAEEPMADPDEEIYHNPIFEE